MVGLIDDHDLEALPGGLVHLLSLGNFFQQVLNDDSVEVADVWRCYF